MKYHPDKNAGDESAKVRFQAISEAYSLLSDPEKRRYYDETGELDDVEISPEDFVAQFQEMMAEMMDGQSVMEMVAGMTPAEIASMPRFPFPKVRSPRSQADCASTACAHWHSAVFPAHRRNFSPMVPSLPACASRPTALMICLRR